jgi:predicted SAM-dependent methyltransferase
MTASQWRLPSELARIRIVLRPLAVARYLRGSPAPKLHLGCGEHVVPGWLNADKFNSRADIYLDVYRRLPFADRSFDLIYAEHLLEHVKIEKVAHVLSEALRVLKPAGLFRVTVPDLEMFARKYVEKDDGFFRSYLEKYAAATAAGERKTWIVRTNGAAFMTLANRRFFHHRWMYDFETVEACGKAVGFSRTVRQRFGQSISAEAAGMDLPARESETLYVDLVK